MKIYTFKIELDGKPENYVRERYSSKGNHFYNKKESKMTAIKKEAERKFSKSEKYKEFRENILNNPDSNYYVSLSVDYYIPIPKADSKKVRSLKEKGILKPITRPDIDNYMKLTADVLHSVLYDDDKRITTLNAEKLYGEPRTVISAKIIIIEGNEE